jgi:hypothetical protein
VLARDRFDAVLWPRTEALASLVAHDRGWSVRMRDRHWMVAVRSLPGPRRGAGSVRSVAVAVSPG